MALIDPSLDALVIRVVYDGPPLAGKTTSLHTLAGKLGGKVHAPEELNGRTVYFDWLAYTGGLFEGRRICCQIVSVPGQAMLASRRRALLTAADAVVFVADTTLDALPSTVSYLKAALVVLAGLPNSGVGIVVQANKRDHPDAAPLDKVHAELRVGDQSLAIVESVATDGAGIREAFVFAVRLALDRVRELMRLNQLQTTRPAIESPDELLAEMRRIEGDSLRLATESGLRHTRLRDTERSVGEAAVMDAVSMDTVRFPDAGETAQSPVVSTEPTLPNSKLPGGMIWPPVEGRVILQDLGSKRVTLAQRSNGAWRGHAGHQWWIESPAAGSFGNLDEGRKALLCWAHTHATGMPWISSRRCIALAPDGAGFFRLWQLVPAAPTLRSRLVSAMNVGAGATAAALVDNARALMSVARWRSEGVCELPLSLGTISATDAGPRFAGLMPYPLSSSTAGSLEPAEFMQSELHFAQAALKTFRDEMLSELHGSGAGEAAENTPEAIVLRYLRGL